MQIVAQALCVALLALELIRHVRLGLKRELALICLEIVGQFGDILIESLKLRDARLESRFHGGILGLDIGGAKDGVLKTDHRHLALGVGQGTKQENGGTDRERPERQP